MISKIKILKSLNEISNNLDSRNLRREADFLDNLVKTAIKIKVTPEQLAVALGLLNQNILEADKDEQLHDEDGEEVFDDLLKKLREEKIDDNEDSI